MLGYAGVGLEYKNIVELWVRVRVFSNKKVEGKWRMSFWWLETSENHMRQVYVSNLGLLYLLLKESLVECSFKRTDRHLCVMPI